MAAHEAALHLPQAELEAARLATLLESLDRPRLLAMAQRARALARPHATQRLADAIERLVA
jgi:UDP-N-acetylglucosamine--N-acetylmuramyl-(pentapeptide) pyrophosphoryl-undecaprenol N-acetylglucosamine transferase